MEEFARKYLKNLNNLGIAQGTFESAEYVSNVQDSIDKAVQALEAEANHRSNVDIQYLKGWLAEQWHAETFNVNAQARGKTNNWAKVPANNRPGEDIVYGNDEVTKHAEVKYYKTGSDTAKALGRPEYTGQDKIVPSDQLDNVKTTAQRLSDKNSLSRPEQAEIYQELAGTANDRIKLDNVESKPLSEKEDLSMAKDFKEKGNIDPDKYNLNTESFINWTDIARQSGEAALHAAVFSAAMTAAPVIWECVKELIEKGELDIDKLTKGGNLVLKGSANAGLRASIAAGITATCKSGAFGEMIKGISPTAIGIATAMTINVISYSAKLQQDQISKQEFAYYCMRDSASLVSGLGGAVIGQLVIPIPVLGALVGNLVGTTIGSVVFENSNRYLLKYCTESGWTFFGIVKQDYTISEEILKEAGFDVFPVSTFEISSFETDDFPVETFKVNSLSFTPLKRGVIACNVIGYH